MHTPDNISKLILILQCSGTGQNLLRDISPLSSELNVQITWYYYHFNYKTISVYDNCHCKLPICAACATLFQQ